MIFKPWQEDEGGFSVNVKSRLFRFSSTDKNSPFQYALVCAIWMSLSVGFLAFEFKILTNNVE